MSLPGNGIFVVRGEMAILVTALRRSTRWGSHSFPNEEYDMIMKTFADLKNILNHVDDLRLLDPATYLGPFLEVIRSKDTTGPVTSLALSAITKFLSYGLIDPTNPSVPTIVEEIADAVTHARFVGTDHASDAVVLMKILQVLRTLMLSPEGGMLTDESVCEIMLSCFRICFETRLSVLLRRNAEQCLRDMTQLIFMRLPQFMSYESGAELAGLCLKSERTGRKIRGIPNLQAEPTIQEKPSSNDEGEKSTKVLDLQGEMTAKCEQTASQATTPVEPPESESTIELPGEESSMKKHGRQSSMDLAANENSSITLLLEKCVGSGTTEHEACDGSKEAPSTTLEEAQPPSLELIEPEIQDAQKIEETNSNHLEDNRLEDVNTVGDNNNVEDCDNANGAKFTHQDSVALQPYGLACIRELLRFLISLCNPRDKQNTSAMVELGLSLIATALEVSADQLANYRELMQLVKDPLCRNLLTLLNYDKIPIVALDLQVSFLLFEALRSHLKLQLEAFFKKLISIISADLTKSTFEVKEITHLSLECIAQLFRIPGLCTELYLNYDCDIYCNNLFEDLVKLLSKNVVSSNAFFMQNLSLDAIMTILETIEQSCVQKSNIENSNLELKEDKMAARGGHVILELGGLDDSSVASDHVTMDISQCLGGKARHKYSMELPTEEDLNYIKNRKRWIAQGTELFNQKPEKGIEYLQEHNILETPLVPMQVAMFLRENPGLDKNMIGEYICKRNSDGVSPVLAAFADSFDYKGLRIDQALRMYLETFRLPGEAPLIFLVMEHFAERWHTCNGNPFANADAAFRLAYAIIMLNMDQHNYNAKKLNIPMTVEDFVRNLRECNGGGDFDRQMLEAVFNAIKNEEIVMPAEHTGIVKENYLWKVLLRRGMGPGGSYLSAPQGAYDDHLFVIVWGPAVSALSSAFEKAPAPPIQDLDISNPSENATFKSLSGLEQCAAIVSQWKPLTKVEGLEQDMLSLDALVLTLCKFTGLLSLPENCSYITIGCGLGASSKAQAALRAAFGVMAKLAPPGGWTSIMPTITALFRARLLPEPLTEAEDYLSDAGKVSLIRDNNASRQGEAGLLSSLYSYIALGETRTLATKEERVLLDLAKDRVAKCNVVGLLTTDTKFLPQDSLQGLVGAIIQAGYLPDAETMQANPESEDIAIFYLELLAKVVVHNRDRVLLIWPSCAAHFLAALKWAGASSDPWACARVSEIVVRVSARLMRSHDAASRVLSDLHALYVLPYNVFYRLSERIAAGLYELVKTSAQNIHTEAEWNMVLTLLETVGAGVWPSSSRASSPNIPLSGASPTSSATASPPYSPASSPACSDDDMHGARGWILVGDSSQQVSLAYPVNIRGPPLPGAASRSCEALTLVVRDVAHVTPYNFSRVVTTLRVFVESSILAGKRRAAKRMQERQANRHRHKRTESDEEEEIAADQYQVLSIQLLDLMHTLHNRTAQIFKWWREEGDQLPGVKIPSETGDEELDLWEVAWMPLLQGIARLCTDRRKQVCNVALGYLQRAVLTAGRGALHGAGWRAAFHHVLLPLLHHMLPRANHHSLARANTLACKVFLHHLSALSTQPMFSSIWLRLVDVQRRLISRDSGSPVEDDTLREAALESLKNMILVMHSVKIFNSDEDYNELWHMTWDRITEFLPNLKNELFPHLATHPSTRQPQLVKPTPMIPQIVPTTILPANPQPDVQLTGNRTQDGVKNPLQKSSMLLQPLGHMMPSPIGIAVPTQQQNYPILYPNPQYQTTVLNSNIVETSLPTYPNQKNYVIIPQNIEEVPNIENNFTAPSIPETQNYDPKHISITAPPIPNYDQSNLSAEQSELYAEYVSNPYVEIKDLSSKEAVLYEPSPKCNDNKVEISEKNHVDASPLMIEKSDYSSIEIAESKSSMFNFSSYFGSGSNQIPPGSEIFDTFLPTQEG